MTISYNWLQEYLPEVIEIEKLSKILTSIGLEVESIEAYESIKGGLKGIVIGEVLSCQQHPNADKLKITTVNIGAAENITIVCGASNVEANQKVVVATVGATIYPINGEAITMKVAKIRGVESFGMICAEDEIGLGTSHDGILVLPEDVIVGTAASDYFEAYTDTIIEIGLTPNRMDAMSHLGVAKDVCAYLVHHQNRDAKVKSPFVNTFKIDNTNFNIEVDIENPLECPRYSGISITGVAIKPSPNWLKNKLEAIGVKSINNIVDITNYILHETGQPLHAFDADAIDKNTIIVQTLEADTPFLTLDNKERKLTATDLIICNGNKQPMCIAGVFGGAKSGISATTKNIFLESACFLNTSVRNTSTHHGLRTDAATRFEKGVDISQTVNVLKRAALLIKEIAGGEFSSDIIDIYSNPKDKTEVALKYHYLKKLSGKNYHPDNVKKILVALGFDIIKDGIDELWVAVPYSKPDITLPADIVEEILRIDGLDNVEVPSSITISPSVNIYGKKDEIKNKVANYLVGIGFNEICTNSITNSKYFTEETLSTTVKMMNNLSIDLDVLRPSMIETGLECIAYNINRKNADLQLFEYGKTYATNATGKYYEKELLALYITGNIGESGWNNKVNPQNFYSAKSIAKAIGSLCGLKDFILSGDASEANCIVKVGKVELGIIKEIDTQKLKTFDIKQPVFYVEFYIDILLKQIELQKIVYKEVSKFPVVQRDLALVVSKDINYNMVQEAVQKTRLNKLTNIKLFDVFESDKLGFDKKSMAINFTFLDEEKTLTDKEVDSMMAKLIANFEKDLGVEIRK